MGLENNTGKATFVNISEGRLFMKDAGSKERTYHDGLSGIIIGIGFKNEEYQGQQFEVAQITLIDGDDKYILQMRTDSGYFRGFVNSLKSSDNPTNKVRISPFSKEVDGKPQTTCFVQQDHITLKHAHTRDNPNGMPELEKTTFKGKTLWDGSKQLKFFKDWLSTIQWQHPAIATELPPTNDFNMPLSKKTCIDEDLPMDDQLPF